MPKSLGYFDWAADPETDRVLRTGGTTRVVGVFDWAADPESASLGRAERDNQSG